MCWLCGACVLCSLFSVSYGDARQLQDEIFLGTYKTHHYITVEDYFKVQGDSLGGK